MLCPLCAGPEGGGGVGPVGTILRYCVLCLSIAILPSKSRIEHDIKDCVLTDGRTG